MLGTHWVAGLPFCCVMLLSTQLNGEEIDWTGLEHCAPYGVNRLHESKIPIVGTSNHSISYARCKITGSIIKIDTRKKVFLVIVFPAIQSRNVTFQYTTKEELLQQGVDVIAIEGILCCSNGMDPSSKFRLTAVMNNSMSH